ncbi:MAG: CmcI family methyltransferase [Nitrososphaeraceae archaeon]|nr:CmcI family methyltransferase [Nitrososphaeraceae archaeon]MDW0333704.1 CmcI family methyltransferase [Nitrososphaeraceae archaeon]
MNRASQVLRRLEKMAEKQFIPSIGPIKGKIITGIIQKYKPRNILEIGTLYGYSAILMADTLKGADEKVVTIEIDKSIAGIARKNIADASLLNKIDVIVGNALDEIPGLNSKFDLLFLDAAKNEYLKYLELAQKNDLKRGTIVVADNVEISKNEMRDYLEYVRNSTIYESKTIETTVEFTPNVKDALEVSIKVA